MWVLGRPSRNGANKWASPIADVFNKACPTRDWTFFMLSLVISQKVKHHWDFISHLFILPFSQWSPKQHLLDIFSSNKEYSSHQSSIYTLFTPLASCVTTAGSSGIKRVYWWDSEGALRSSCPLLGCQGTFTGMGCMEEEEKLESW